MNRLTVLVLTINTGAWFLFLLATPRLPYGDDPVVRHRLEMDAQAAGMNLIDHPPSLLAGRPLTWVTLAEKPLGLTAGPAVVWVQSMTVPDKYWQTGPTVVESYWIACIAFVLSTAGWVAIVRLPAWWRSIRRAS